MNKCNKCFEMKPRNLFHIQNRITGRRESVCKECRNERRRQQWFHISQAREMEKKIEENSIPEYDIPKIDGPNYQERLAIEIAKGKMNLSDLKFELKYAVDGKIKYNLILNLLRTWKRKTNQI